MPPKKYNEVAWWVGGLLVVAVLIGAVYVLAGGMQGSKTVATATATPKAVAQATATPTATPAAATDTTLGVGATAPAAVNSATDLDTAEASLQSSDTTAITNGLDQMSTDLGSN